MKRYKLKEKSNGKSHKAIYENDRFITLMYDNLFPISYFRYELVRVK